MTWSYGLGSPWGSATLAARLWKVAGKTKGRANSCGLSPVSQSHLAARTHFVQRLFSTHWFFLFYFRWPLHVGSGRPDSAHWPSGSPSLSSEVSVAVRYPAITPLFCFALLSLFSKIVSPHFELPGRAFQPFIFLILLCVDRVWEQRITGLFRSISLGGGVFILYCEWCFCSGFQPEWTRRTLFCWSSRVIVSYLVTIVP